MKLWCWRRLLRVTWITRWSNQSIIKEINPEYWKEYCWSWSSSTLATWCEAWTHWKRPWWWESLKAKGKRSGRGWESITDSTDMNLSKLQETEVDRGAWHATVHGVAKSQTYWLSDWKTTLLEIAFFFFFNLLIFEKTMNTLVVYYMKKAHSLALSNSRTICPLILF